MFVFVCLLPTGTTCQANEQSLCQQNINFRLCDRLSAHEFVFCVCVFVVSEPSQ
jgi:hypothetical protein